jgi:poly(A) polymerase
MQIAPDQIDPDAAKVVQRLRHNDHLTYLVGGCVRDLLLGLKPKDFDVVTSATPNEIKRLFGNCRIIGRRFRLAHIFYGPKIIETSTFRANPRELEDDQGDGGDNESGDLLIRRDNVFGTPEEDARRRDFTINGLFYDMKTGQVIDHVNGLVDLEARLVRTIGDPDIRFREDPIRILRAVKFAARCSLTIEPETYRRMMEHRGDIAKCAQARVSEEFYRLLRAGAARRSMELLVETDMLELLAPDLARALRPKAADAGPSGEGSDEAADEAANEASGEASGRAAAEASGEADARVADESHVRRARLWAYLGALDRSTERQATPPSNALILSVLMLPPLRDALDPASSGVRDIGQLVGHALEPALERLRASRRESELARQILLAARFLLPPGNPRRKRDIENKDFYEEAMRLVEIVADAEALDPTLAARPILSDGAAPGVEGDADAEDALPPELVSSEARDGGRRRRRGRRGGRLRDDGTEAPARSEARPERADRPTERPSTERQTERHTERQASAPRPSAARPGHPPAPVPTAPVDLEALFAAARSLSAAPPRPAFLGNGAFGGPWGGSD